MNRRTTPFCFDQHKTLVQSILHGLKSNFGGFFPTFHSLRVLFGHMILLHLSYTQFGFTMIENVSENVPYSMTLVQKWLAVTAMLLLQHKDG